MGQVGHLTDPRIMGSLDVDLALSNLGRWSRWHVINYILCGVMYGYVALHMMAIVFMGLVPEYHCAVPEGVLYNVAIPVVQTEGESFAGCSHYLNYSSSTNVSVEGCPDGWVYGNQVYSIVQEWDLVCSRDYMVSLSQMIMVLGIAFGALILSPQIDRFGRKPVLLTCVLGMSIVAFVTAWVRHYWLFLGLRFLNGALQQGVMAASCVAAYELFTPGDRTIPSLLINMFFGLWVMGLALIAYFVRNWRHLLMATAVPGMLVVPLFWFLPESLHFLVAKGRFEDAVVVLKKAARLNNVVLPPSVLGQQDMEPLQEQSYLRNAKSTHANHVYTTLDIFRSRTLLVYTFILTFLWSSLTFVYHSLMLNTAALAGDPYINFVLSGLMDILAAWVATVVAHRVGRRWPCFIFYMITAASVIFLIFVPTSENGATNLQVLLVTLAMIGKFGISCCFWVVMVFTSELYPTTLRATGAGISSVGGRLANIVAPFTSLMIPILPWLLNVLIGVVCLLSAALVLLLPETLGRPLPQTIVEVEQWPRTLTPQEKASFRASMRREGNASEKGYIQGCCTPEIHSDDEDRKQRGELINEISV